MMLLDSDMVWEITLDVGGFTKKISVKGDPCPPEHLKAEVLRPLAIAYLGDTEVCKIASPPIIWFRIWHEDISRRQAIYRPCECRECDPK